MSYRVCVCVCLCVYVVRYSLSLLYLFLKHIEAGNFLGMQYNYNSILTWSVWHVGVQKHHYSIWILKIHYTSRIKYDLECLFRFVIILLFIKKLSNRLVNSPYHDIMWEIEYFYWFGKYYADILREKLIGENTWSPFW